MKRCFILFALVFALLLCGCGEKPAQMTYIGADAAKQLALENCGLSASAASVTADLNTRDGVDYYHVDITAAGETYQYDIDALTGVVIEARLPSAAAESPADDAEALNAAVPVQTTPEAPAAVSEPTSGIMSADEVKAKALTHAGLTSEQVTFVKCKLDNEHGRQVYELEFYVSDSYAEYEYEIDAGTGEVLNFDYDAKDSKGTASANSGSMITAEEAKALALAQVPGASDSDFQYFKTDYDDGRTEYEGKIIYNNMVYEFEIDAYSGAIRSWEAEPMGH